MKGWIIQVGNLTPRYFTNWNENCDVVTEGTGKLYYQPTLSEGMRIHRDRQRRGGREYNDALYRGRVAVLKLLLIIF